MRKSIERERIDINYIYIYIYMHIQGFIHDFSMEEGSVSMHIADLNTAVDFDNILVIFKEKFYI